ncbi:threonine ammonia-lyase [Thermomonospora curvata]|uniref:Pyridoxal-5'-phosphate-dependent protein beta subunit n=1 Tax=Thermomonospora curvata (strain ATCC 19995 / DSM 43183 / JCM 3096 / KCTC 9072 / NBRC 15933 / NCIMB 10081 / Henssen B9) TaxID=471852 RepID=D1A3V4_THECD|nr:pyridoxal-phosphate dependent enzyme [Thermomonospora curvata]ACY98007.1 Pyridoxal-5'-phosphate-dependent protein beta subunit [Thermomonospora curvata DSM 43183]
MRDLPPSRRPLPTAEGIERAARAIDPVFTGSPAHDSAELAKALGVRRAVVKDETGNPIRSFKGRGADWFMAHLPADDTEPLVTASVGNFGQGMAYAARRRGRALTVFAAENASPVKVAAMRRLGAEVRLGGRDFDEARARAIAHARAGGGRLVTDGDEPRIAEGAGTIAWELTRQVADPLEVLLVPLGNGALAGGVGTWIKHAWPGTRVIAVAAEGAPAMARSWHEHALITTPTADTIADGIAVRVPIPYALQVMRRCVDDVVVVPDEAIVAAMRLLHRTLGLVTEPAGAAGAAAVLADPAAFAGLSVGTVACGANLTDDRLRRWLPQAARCEG